MNCPEWFTAMEVFFSCQLQSPADPPRTGLDRRSMPFHVFILLQRFRLHVFDLAKDCTQKIQFLVVL